MTPKAGSRARVARRVVVAPGGQCRTPLPSPPFRCKSANFLDKDRQAKNLIWPIKFDLKFDLTKFDL